MCLNCFSAPCQVCGMNGRDGYHSSTRYKLIYTFNLYLVRSSLWDQDRAECSRWKEKQTLYIRHQRHSQTSLNRFEDIISYGFIYIFRRLSYNSYILFSHLTTRWRQTATNGNSAQHQPGLKCYLCCTEWGTVFYNWTGLSLWLIYYYIWHY